MKMNVEDKAWARLKTQKKSNKLGLGYFMDTDGDKVPNILDCEPFNKNKQGVVHDVAKKLGEVTGITGALERRSERQQLTKEAQQEARFEASGLDYNQYKDALTSKGQKAVLMQAEQLRRKEQLKQQLLQAERIKQQRRAQPIGQRISRGVSNVGAGLSKAAQGFDLNKLQQPSQTKDLGAFVGQPQVKDLGAFVGQSQQPQQKDMSHYFSLGKTKNDVSASEKIKRFI